MTAAWYALGMILALIGLLGAWRLHRQAPPAWDDKKDGGAR